MSGLQDRLRRLRDRLSAGLVERDVAVRLALLAALAGEHLLLVGPPGTAKSLVARRLHLAFKGAGYFERLLTRFSVPEELFGPLSIKRLEEDRYERLTESYLPSAHIAFLDEIFKANSAILNALLTLLNERQFDNGTRRVPTPLLAVVAASNELPEEDEQLDALFDRFLLRLHIGPVPKDAFPELLKLRGNDEPDVDSSLKLTPEELEEVRGLAEKCAVPDEVEKLLCDLRDWCDPEKLPVSDRRWRKVVKLLQTSAWTNGRDSVSIWDCWLLQHCLWNRAEDREKIYQWYAARVGFVSLDQHSNIARVINGWESKLNRDKNEQRPLQDAKGKPLYIGEDGKPVPTEFDQKYRSRAPLYVLQEGSYGNRRGRPLDPTNNGKGYTKKELEAHLPISRGGSWLIYGTAALEEYIKLAEYIKDEKKIFITRLKPAMEPVKHKPPYIKHCLQQLEGLQSEIKSHDTGLRKQIESFDSDIREHIWVTDDFVEPASRGLQQARDDARKLLARLKKLIEEYGKLPQEEEDTGSGALPASGEEGPGGPAHAPSGLVRTTTRRPPPK